jgi:hypothetical protein
VLVLVLVRLFVRVRVLVLLLLLLLMSMVVVVLVGEVGASGYGSSSGCRWFCCALLLSLRLLLLIHLCLIWVGREAPWFGTYLFLCILWHRLTLRAPLGVQALVDGWTLTQEGTRYRCVDVHWGLRPHKNGTKNEPWLLGEGSFARVWAGKMARPGGWISIAVKELVKCVLVFALGCQPSPAATWVTSLRPLLLGLPAFARCYLGCLCRSKT